MVPNKVQKQDHSFLPGHTLEISPDPRSKRLSIFRDSDQLKRSNLFQMEINLTKEFVKLEGGKHSVKVLCFGDQKETDGNWHKTNYSDGY